MANGHRNAPRNPTPTHKPHTPTPPPRPRPQPRDTPPHSPTARNTATARHLPESTRRTAPGSAKLVASTTGESRRFSREGKSLLGRGESRCIDHRRNSSRLLANLIARPTEGERDDRRAESSAAKVIAHRQRQWRVTRSFSSTVVTAAVTRSPSPTIEHYGWLGGSEWR